MPVGHEKVLLQRLLREMDDSGKARRERRLLENIVNRLGAAIIVLAVVGTGLLNLVWHDILLAIAAFALGVSVALDAVRNAHARDLALVEKYLDRGGIERRLRDLTAPSED